MGLVLKVDINELFYLFLQKTLANESPISIMRPH